MLKLESVKRTDGKCLKNPSIINEAMDCAADPLLLELQGVPRHLQAQSEQCAVGKDGGTGTKTSSFQSIVFPPPLKTWHEGDE